MLGCIKRWIYCINWTVFFNKIEHLYNRVNTVISLRRYWYFGLILTFSSARKRERIPMFVYAQSPVHSNVLFQHNFVLLSPKGWGLLSSSLLYPSQYVGTHECVFARLLSKPVQMCDWWQASPNLENRARWWNMMQVCCKDNGLDSFVMEFHDLLVLNQWPVMKWRKISSPWILII